MTITYNLNIPNAPNNPSSDQPLMQQNTNSINTIIGVDHQTFSGTNAGYHTIIHQTTQLVQPAPIVGVNQVFSMIPPSNIPPTGDTQLFSLTGLGGFLQMTGNKANINGYCWCAGILFQWGFVSPITSGSLQSVNFNVIFPNNVFNIQATLKPVSATNVVQTVSVVSVSSTAFNYNVTGVAGYNGLVWLAIGN